MATTTLKNAGSLLVILNAFESVVGASIGRIDKLISTLNIIVDNDYY